jgi:stearoyl-CoA desaturase (delta-9 desaturase)
MFEMSPVIEKLFYILTFISQGSSYLSPYAYGVMHRLHHAHTDTEHDPHSPEHDENIIKMMWRTYQIYSGIFSGKIEVEEKYRRNVTNWESFDRFACATGTRIGWVLLYILFYYLFAPSPFFYLLLPIHILMGPVHGAIINWCSHKYGYINFRMKNTSTNLMKWDIFLMGEGLHNNHHKFSSRANFGVKKAEFDPSYPIIKWMHKAKIIELSRPNESKELIHEDKETELDKLTKGALKFSS